jgi:thymidylate synthase ThyX
MYSATMVQASIYNGIPIYTMDVQFPRAALAEFLTHRVMSKNTASTRAIPIKSHVEFVRKNPYIPDWTKNQGGMQGGLLSDTNKEIATESLMLALDYICDFVEYLGGDDSLGNLGIHKQDAGRYLEPFSYITLRVTSTQWKNFFWLRNDEAAYPPIQRIAIEMQKAINQCTPMQLNVGEYHVPSVHRERGAHTGEIYYYSPEGKQLTLDEAIELSMSLCAQQSFRKADGSEKKTQSVIDKLFNGNKVHASPSEHQATPIPQFTDYGDNNEEWPLGVTHIDRKHRYWSANFCGWIQHRQLLPNHDKELME